MLRTRTISTQPYAKLVEQTSATHLL